MIAGNCDDGGMITVHRRLVPAALVLLVTGLVAQSPSVVPPQNAPTQTSSAQPADQQPQQPRWNGRVERHAGMRVVRTWGTPAERGYAHGRLLANEIAAILCAELTARFAQQQPLLKQARAALGRLIEYPEDAAAELDALWRGVVDSGVDRNMPELERAFDQQDLLVANALDVFGLMGCSSFTVWGDRVAGGGVLTARNFDWPFTGDHMLDHAILLVQHWPNGRAVATVAWPGYIGAVTGVSSDGVAAYLHVGSAKWSMTPEPSSWPSAIAARRILARGAAGTAKEVFASAEDLLSYTSPPAGYLTHVVLPRIPADMPPARAFETDVDSCVVGQPSDGPVVLTNHFCTRTDGRKASKDSLDRQRQLQRGISGCFDVGDRQIDIGEAWQMLTKVQRGGAHFGTLHSLVFRLQPWHFEIRLADHQPDGLVAAPESGKNFVLTRKQVFADGLQLGKPAGESR